MENWGLITYKETYILYSPTESSASDQRSVAATISHESAHMWFGNLVTLSWWNDLWLNEGYASYIEYKGQDAINPEWNIMNRFLIGDLHGALRADSLKSAKPLSATNITTPDAITAQFNTINYSKGSSILRMLESWLGSAVFQDCTRKYLKAYENSYVNSSQWSQTCYAEAVQNATKTQDGKACLDKWIYKNGFPVLNVTRMGDSKLLIKQRAYHSIDEELDDPWCILVTYGMSNGRTGNFTLNQVEQTVELPYNLTGEWVKLNLGSAGYYMVNYEENDWKKFANELASSTPVLSNLDRTNLIFDAFQLSSKSKVSFDILFSLFDSLKYETDYLPWSAASTAISSLINKMSGSDGQALMNFKLYIKNLVSSVYDSNVDFNDVSTKTLDQM